MQVRLLSYSQPTAEFSELGIADAQELIAYCARVIAEIFPLATRLLK